MQNAVACDNNPAYKRRNKIGVFILTFFVNELI